MTWWRITRSVRGCARTVREPLQQRESMRGVFCGERDERERWREVVVRLEKERVAALLSRRPRPTCAGQPRTVYPVGTYSPPAVRPKQQNFLSKSFQQPWTICRSIFFSIKVVQNLFFFSLCTADSP